MNNKKLLSSLLVLAISMMPALVLASDNTAASGGVPNAASFDPALELPNDILSLHKLQLEYENKITADLQTLAKSDNAELKTKIQAEIALYAKNSKAIKQKLQQTPQAEKKNDEQNNGDNKNNHEANGDNQNKDEINDTKQKQSDFEFPSVGDINDIKNLDKLNDLKAAGTQKASELKADLSKTDSASSDNLNKQLKELNTRMEAIDKRIQNLQNKSVSQVPSVEDINKIYSKERLNSLKNYITKAIDDLNNLLSKADAVSAGSLNKQLSDLNVQLKAITDRIDVVTKSDSEVAGKKDEYKRLISDQVKNAKDFEKFRSDLKNATVFDNDLRAKYEALLDILTQQKNDLLRAVKVKQDLIEKTYVKGDTESFANLGQMYKAAGVDGIKTFVNGRQPNFENKPFKENNTTLVPIRAISEALGAQVKWDEGSQKATVLRGNTTIELFIDKKIALVDGVEKTLDAAPKKVNNSTFLPIRFISENLNADVSWQEEGQIVIIDDKTGQNSNTSAASAK